MGDLQRRPRCQGPPAYDWVRVELVALSAPGIKPGRKVVLPEPGTTDLATMAKRLLDLEIGEDGSLRLFCGRASDRFGTRFIPDEATEAVFESLVLGSPSAWC